MATTQFLIKEFNLKKDAEYESEIDHLINADRKMMLLPLWVSR
jgi:hypothetical protein